MSSETERGDDSEVPTAAAKGPEEIVVCRGTRCKDFALSSYYLAGQKVIDGHPMFANEPTDTAAERESGYPRLWNDSRWDGKAEQMRFAVELSEGRSTLYAYGLICFIDVDGPHAGEVYDNAVVAKGSSADIVATPAYSSEELVFAGEVDGFHHIGDAGASGNEPRVFIDAGIPDPAGLWISVVPRLEKLTSEGRFEGFDVHTGRVYMIAGGCGSRQKWTA